MRIVNAAINVTLHRAHQQQIAEDNERQRSRLSYELSEELAQKLVGVSMQIDLLRQRLAELAPGNALDLAPITSWLRETVQQSCDLAQRFYPAELDRLGFLSALENLVRTHSLLYAIPCTLKAAKDYAGLDNRTGIQLYRLVESATLYVVSTGRSRGVALHLDARPTAWTMSVTSEGDGTKGCESCAADLERRILGQRTELLGGTLRIRPRPRGGAKVICVLPRQDQR